MLRVDHFSLDRIGSDIQHLDIIEHGLIEVDSLLVTVYLWVHRERIHGDAYHRQASSVLN